MAGGWEPLGLMPELVQTCEEDFDWILPSAIQDECIPLLLGGGDVMGSAETGSGKTAAFALPVLQLCVEYKEQYCNNTKEKPDDEKGKGNNNKALQQSSDASWFVMSTQDRDPPIAFHPNGKGLRLQSRDTTRWAGCRCSAGITLKREEGDVAEEGFSFEVTVMDKDGTVRVGWSSEDSSLQLGTDAEGYGYGGTGMKVNKGKYDPFPNKSNKIQFSEGDVVGCHLKLSRITHDENTNQGKKVENKEKKVAATISFSKNGKMLGQAFEVTGTAVHLSLYPTICMKNTECELNFGGDKPLRFPLPEGHQALSAAVHKVGGEKNRVVVNPRDFLSSQLAQQRNSDKKGPLALVIEPTRDLAEQSYRAFVDLGKRLQDPPVQAALLVGGIKPTETLKMLDQNQVDVLVGTPPIIASYMKKGTIQPSRCRFFVLDEADELISTDSVNHIRAIYGRLLASTDMNQSRFNRLQVCFFSATLHSKEVRDLAETLCHKPLWVDLRGQNDSILPDTVHHCVVIISPTASPQLLKEGQLIETDAVHRNGKLSAKVEIDKLSGEASQSECIKQFKPRAVLDVMEKFSMEQVLIFCRTNLDCDLMEKYLKQVGGAGGMGIADKYSCRVLAGMRSMEERQQSLQAFKDGEVRILIATDVAARGIDIRNLPYVINCTLPDKPEIYVHRVGRVGRAERMGLAISLVSTVKERVWFCRKGKKPPCSDTREFDKGGNCIWYDEPKCLQDIENLLKKNQVSMTKLKWPELELPADIQKIIKSGGYGEHAKGGGALNPEVKLKMEKVEDQVKQLELTESSLQTDYWMLRNRFNSIASK